MVARRGRPGAALGERREHQSVHPSTAETGDPGRGEFGPGPSPQQAEASDAGLSASSKVITSTPSLPKRGEFVTTGTHCVNHASALARSPG